jgi:hypothetical protein
MILYFMQKARWDSLLIFWRSSGTALKWLHSGHGSWEFQCILSVGFLWEPGDTGSELLLPSPHSPLTLQGDRLYNSTMFWVLLCDSHHDVACEAGRLVISFPRVRGLLVMGIMCWTSLWAPLSRSFAEKGREEMEWQLEETVGLGEPDFFPW